MHDELKLFFLDPKTPAQRQYEALRAYVMEGVSARQAAELYGFTENSLYALAHDLRAGKLRLFPKRPTGPKDRRLTPHTRDRIAELREQGLSAQDIAQRLALEGIAVHARSIERILKEAGFAKLPRRSPEQRGLTVKNTLTAQPAQNLDMGKLEPFHEDCQVAGAFLFLPYILESGLLDVWDALPMPESARIGKRQAGLSFLLLKLIGGERLCHVRQYDHDVGFGVFAGLNVLPKPAYMGSYSCRVSAALCQRLQKEMVGRFIKCAPGFSQGDTLNLDFHSIPHFGEQSQMEKVWCGARSKAMKGANTFFAQDADTRAVVYANADVLRKDGAQEVLNFADYWKDVRGAVKETLVFDARLTTYDVLGKLDAIPVHFITLRIRNKTLAAQTDALPQSVWQPVKLPIPKRKHQEFLAYESEVTLPGCPNPFRQIVIKDHGRLDPTYVITNNRELALTDVLAVYARRWRIENKLAELVDFFNINALSSPIMARIYFDLLLSVAASFLYQQFARDLPRFEDCLAPEIFRQFIDIPGTVKFDGSTFEVRMRKRAHTPILLGVKKLANPILVPWLDNRPLRIIWTA
jgi:transposase